MQAHRSHCSLAVALWFLAAGFVPLGAGAQQPDEAALVQPDIFLIELRRRARGSNVQRAESIRDALRIRLDDEANTFLELLADRQLTDEQRAMMVNIISGERLLRVTVDENFSEQARQQATALLEGRRRFQGEAPRIDAAIAAIGTGDPERELPAYRTLLSAGVASLGPLALAAAGETQPRRRDELLRVMARLGEESLEALSQLAIYGDDAVRAGALVSLDRLRSVAALPYLGVAAHTPVATAAERQVGTELLVRRYGKVPPHHEVEQYLLDRLAELRRAAGRLGRSEATALTWTLDPEAATLAATTTTAGLAAQRRVADMSRLLHRLGGLSDRAHRAALIADLAYRYQLDPQAVIEQTDELRALWGEDALDAGSLSAVIAEAIAEDDLAAAVAAMSLIDQNTPGEPAELMTTHSSQLAPLVQAVQHSVPQVRYEAAAAIGRLQYTRPYAGSSFVLRRWIEMASLQREPTALVVETRTGLEAHIERLIASLGYRVEVASSVIEAIELVDGGGDFRMIIATTILPDRSVLELVDGVRRRPLGLRIPIFIHGPDDHSTFVATEDQRWSAPVVHLLLPATVAGWGIELEGVVNQPLGRLQGLEPLTAVQRFDFRRQATEVIGLISSQPDQYHFYDFPLLAAAGLGAVPIPSGVAENVAFGDPRLALLSVSASEQAQTVFVDMLLQSSAIAGRHGQIGEALQLSIARNGVLLSSSALSRLDDALLVLPEGPQRGAITEVLETIADRFGLEPAEASDG